MSKKDSLKRYGRDFLIKLLKQMLLIRRFEENAAQMYGLRKIGGFCHLYIGEEAVAVGSIAALDLQKDYVVAAYRDHGHALACGISPGVIMAELFGKAAGCSKGKGGSMHLFDAGKHMLGGNGIVGGQMPVAAGVAFKIRYKKEDGVVLCFFGDGAIHQGAFHESLNLARIWKLPVIYICENNQYGMGTDFRRVSSVEDFSLMGASYGIPGKQVNGMDVLAVYEALAEGVAGIRKDSGPRFFEIKTYRYRGHSMSDPAKYRTKEELESYKNQDPLIILKGAMINEDVLTEAEYESLDNEVRELCKAAVDFADKSEEPSLDALYEDIYSEEPVRVDV
ncbi:MAG: pyruvate dehydrogenase (acetyl-transferring) E1 component subunit alpha [Spirochaetota bacterium]